ncbi:MAG: hypothetical protein PHY16_02105 [Methylobacter sp.]|nr:hypothetical protein [Methylobacter sp.]
MNAEPTKDQRLPVNREKLLAFVRAIIGGRGREDDEHPLPSGPWDPLIRAALERTYVFGPRPEPWKFAFASILARHPEAGEIIGGGPGFGEEVALNPQPLPPRYAFLAAVAQTVISRAGLLQDIADATARNGEQQGIIIVGGHISKFVDDWCPTPPRLKWPFPGPRPHWFTHEFDGIDLLVMATQFEQAAQQTFSPALRQDLANAGAKFVDAGLSKLQ